MHRMRAVGCHINNLDNKHPTSKAITAASGENRFTPTEFFSSFSNYQLLDISIPSSQKKDSSMTNVSIAKPTQSEILGIRTLSSTQSDVTGAVDQSAVGGHGAGASRSSACSSPLAKAVTAWNTQNDAIKEPPLQQRTSLFSRVSVNTRLMTLYIVASLHDFDRCVLFRLYYREANTKG